MTIPKLLSWATAELGQASISSPRVDAEWVLAHLLNCTRSELLLHPPPFAHLIETYQSFIAQRKKRIPLQHILGETEFYGLPFQTTPQALIPRPDTETLIEVAITHLKQQHPKAKILDIGTGSGIIAITLAHELPQIRAISIDISRPALQLAHHNANRNGVSDRIKFVCSDLTQALSPTTQFDAILSNPPYIPTDDIPTLDPEVRNFDPHLALDGGQDGLEVYRKLIPACILHLKPQGLLAFEMGHNQAPALTNLLSKHEQLQEITVLPDLAGHTRVVCARKTQ